MEQPTPQQLKKLRKIHRVVEAGNLAVVEHILELEDEIEGIKNRVEGVQDGERGKGIESIEQDGAIVRIYLDDGDYFEVEGLKGEKGADAVFDQEAIVEATLARIPKFDETRLRKELTTLIPKIDEAAIIARAVAALPAPETIELPEPLTPEQIRDNLEALKGENRLSREAIAGLDDLTTREDVDRAISILDKRTSFLINKTTTAGGSGTVTNVSSATADLTVTSPGTTPVLTVVSAPKLTTARTINGVAFDGTANITVADATKTPTTRLINTTAPLSGGGDLSADRTLTTSMNTNKLIGRGTAAVGVMEEITLGTNLSLTGTTLNATGGSTTPTGTGFTHITAGVQDAAAKLVDTADVNASQITNAKLAQVATATFKGRTTAATGDPEDLTIAQAKTLLNLTGINSGDQTITLTGEATGTGTGSFAVTLTNLSVISKVLTGYVSGAGVVAATDSILQAIQKLNGNISGLVTGVSSVFGRTGAVVATAGDYTTAQITEVTNLFFTNARAIASTLTGYVSGAGTISAADTVLTAIQKLNGNIAAAGTVTSASVVSANGLAGTVATPTTTPAITLSTTVTGVLKGNGTALSAAVAGTDYQAPITLTTTGTSGAATFISNTLNVPNYSAGSGGITRSVNSISTATTAGATASVDYVYLVSGATTLTLPTAVGNSNRYSVKNAGSGDVTVATTSAQTIDGGATAVLTANLQGAIDLISNGSNWVII